MLAREDSMTTITMAMQREPLGDCQEALVPLLHEHYKEISHYPDIPLDPDWEAYARAERADALRVYTLRDFGALRGYASFFVNHSMHYRGSRQAVQDVIYLVPELRHLRIGWEFINWIDGQLRDEGVQVCYHHVKLAHNYGPTLKALGYEAIESVWGRRLDR